MKPPEVIEQRIKRTLVKCSAAHSQNSTELASVATMRWLTTASRNHTKLHHTGCKLAARSHVQARHLLAALHDARSAADASSNQHGQATQYCRPAEQQCTAPAHNARIPVLHTALRPTSVKKVCVQRVNTLSIHSRELLCCRTLAELTSRQQHHKHVHSNGAYASMATGQQQFLLNCWWPAPSNKTPAHNGVAGVGVSHVPVILEIHPYHLSKQNTLRSTFRRCSVPMCYSTISTKQIVLAISNYCLCNSGCELSSVTCLGNEDWSSISVHASQCP